MYYSYHFNSCSKVDIAKYKMKSTYFLRSVCFDELRTASDIVYYTYRFTPQSTQFSVQFILRYGVLSKSCHRISWLLPVSLTFIFLAIWYILNLESIVKLQVGCNFAVEKIYNFLLDIWTAYPTFVTKQTAPIWFIRILQFE